MIRLYINFIVAKTNPSLQGDFIEPCWTKPSQAEKLNFAITKGGDRLGCDLNLCIEYKAPHTNSWDCLGSAVFSPLRNYQMFALMAGVRDKEGASLYSARGLLQDISYFTALNVFQNADIDFKLLQDGYHDHSWLTLEEYRYCIDNYNGAKESVLDYQAILAVMEFLNETGCKSRIIFWFCL